MKIIIAILGIISGVMIFILYDSTIFHLRPNMYKKIYDINKNKTIIFKYFENSYINLCNNSYIKEITYKDKKIIIYKQKCEVNDVK